MKPLYAKIMLRDKRVTTSCQAWRPKNLFAAGNDRSPAHQCTAIPIIGLSNIPQTKVGRFR
ncbi:hypothetical protein [Novosphingobium sp. UBA1939]|uniref:hypothetical protein n=1 Tax=Novosphingobium sp. UBA1939 TaxID=1946982 RepID=UPI0025F39571|nr:hypothetical protein [Novosphingobium sp. UBA1939]